MDGARHKDVLGLVHRSSRKEKRWTYCSRPQAGSDLGAAGCLLSGGLQSASEKHVLAVTHQDGGRVLNSRPYPSGRSRSRSRPDAGTPYL
jgi:hypothetical protein